MNYKLHTKVVHSGEPRPRISGAVVTPAFQSSTFAYDGEGDYHDNRYARLSNTPGHIALHEKIAALEGCEAVLVTASGMAAICTALLTVLLPNALLGSQVLGVDGHERRIRVG